MFPVKISDGNDVKSDSPKPKSGDAIRFHLHSLYVDFVNYLSLLVVCMSVYLIKHEFPGISYPVLSPHVVCIRERKGEYIDEFVSLLGVYNLPASSQITDRRHLRARGGSFLFQAKFAPVCFIK